MEPEFFVREMNSGGEVPVSTHLGSCRLLPFMSCGDGAGGFWLVVVRVHLWAVMGWCLDVVRGLVGCGMMWHCHVWALFLE